MAVDEFDLNEFSDLFDEAEKKYGLPKGLLYRQAHQESKGNPVAESDAGAQGLMQFLPETADSLGIDPWDAKQAIDGAGRLMRENLNRYKNVPDALRAYHGGTDKKQWGEKTQDYVSQILKPKKGLPQVGEVQVASNEPLSKFDMMQQALESDAADVEPVSKYKLMEDALKGDEGIETAEIAPVGSKESQKTVKKVDKEAINPALDVIESLPTGIVRGVNEITKVPAGMYKFASRVGTQVGNKLHNLINPDAKYTAAQETANIKNAGNDAAGQMLESIPTLNELTGGNIPKVAGMAFAAPMNLFRGNNLSGKDLADAAQDYTGENALHEPQTGAGEVAANVAAAVPQGRLFGVKAAPAIGAGLGMAAAQEASPDNPLLELVGGAAGGMAGKGVENRVGKAPQVNATEPALSDNILEKSIKRDNKAAPEVETKLNQMGDEAMLADAAGENVRGVARAIANMPGPARDIAVQALEERHAGQPERIQQAALGNLGVDPKSTYYATADELVSKRKAESAPAYQKAFEGGSIAPLETQFAEEIGKHNDAIGGLENKIVSARESLQNESYLKTPEFKEMEGKAVETSGALEKAKKQLQAARNDMTLAKRAQADAGDNVYRTSGANKQAGKAQAAIDKASAAYEKAQAADKDATARLKDARTKAKSDIEDQIKGHEDDIRNIEYERGDVESVLKEAQADRASGKKGAVWNRRIQQFLDDPILKAGLRQGLEIQRLEALAEGKKFNPSEYGITSMDAEGNPVVSKVPNMRLLDAGKRGLDAIIESYRDPTTGKLNLDSRGRAVNMVKQSYVAELKKLNPDYAEALQKYAGPSQSKDAMDLGSRFMRNDAEINEKILKGLSDTDKEFFRIGVADAITDIIQKSPDNADITKRIFGSKQKRAALRSVFPDAKSFKAFEDMVNNEKEFAKTYRSVTQGSRTTPLAEDISDLRGNFGNATEAAMGFGKHAIELGKRNALGKAVYLGSHALKKVIEPKELSQADAVELAHKLFTPVSELKGNFPVKSKPSSNSNRLSTYIDYLARGANPALTSAPSSMQSQ